MELPNGHQGLMPYLILTDTAGFIDFTSRVFQASLAHVTKREDGTGIMHSEIVINGATVMCCDANAEWTVATANLFVYVKNADETYQKAIENGATSVMDLSDQSYGRTCGIADPCGNVWWITAVK